MSTTTTTQTESAPGRAVRESESAAWQPSALAGISLIVRRELASYFRSFAGYAIAGAFLLVDGLYYNAEAVTSSARYSTDVLSTFIYGTSGMVLIFSPLIAMRLIAEERQSGSLPLLTTSSLSDGQIIFAKYLSALMFTSLLTLATIYMPLLIFVNGKVSLGHIFAGYVGLLCLASATTAIGTFGSAIANSQVVAVVISGVITAVLTLLWTVAGLVEGSLSDFLQYVSLHNKHFRPFMNGTIDIKDIAFYGSVTLLFLVLARNALEGRRWKP